MAPGAVPADDLGLGQSDGLARARLSETQFRESGGEPADRVAGRLAGRDTTCPARVPCAILRKRIDLAESRDLGKRRFIVAERSGAYSSVVERNSLFYILKLPQTIVFNGRFPGYGAGHERAVRGDFPVPYSCGEAVLDMCPGRIFRRGWCDRDPAGTDRRRA